MIPGGFIGDEEEEYNWVRSKVKFLEDAVTSLGKLSIQHPQTSYAGMLHSLQREWGYL